MFKVNNKDTRTKLNFEHKVNTYFEHKVKAIVNFEHKVIACWGRPIPTEFTSLRFPL